MPDRSNIKHQGPRDFQEIAYSIYQEAVGEIEPREEKEKDPAAVELGRRGGNVGGKARAAKLSAEQRSEIAKRAAAARWGKKRG